MSRARDLANIGPSVDAGGITGRNLIINGAMTVAQRGTSQTGVTSSGYASAPDRFGSLINGLGTWTLSQSSDAPDGFSSSYKWECTVADSSISAGDFGILLQRMEGQNLQHLKKGSSNAESLTASFWVKSSKTGTYILEMYENHSQRSISKSYTISSANTWEYKSITIPGDTVGTINNDNTESLIPAFWVAAGSDYSSGTLQTSWGSIVNANRAVGVVNLADTVGNTWQVTGFQLELGEQATPFEHRSYGDELRRCQRYYEQTGAGGFAKANSSTEFWIGHKFSVTKRANPTTSIIDPNSYVRVYEFGIADRNSDSTPAISATIANVNGVITRVGTFSGISAGDTGMLGGKDGDSSASTFAFDAEL